MLTDFKSQSKKCRYQKGVAFQPEENPRNKDKQSVVREKSSVNSER